MLSFPFSRHLQHPKHPHPLRRYLKESGWNCDGSCNYRSSRSPIPMPRFRCTQGESELVTFFL